MAQHCPAQAPTHIISYTSQSHAQPPPPGRCFSKLNPGQKWGAGELDMMGYVRCQTTAQASKKEERQCQPHPRFAGSTRKDCQAPPSPPRTLVPWQGKVASPTLSFGKAGEATCSFLGVGGCIAKADQNLQHPKFRDHRSVPEACLESVRSFVTVPVFQGTEQSGRRQAAE